MKKLIFVGILLFGVSVIGDDVWGVPSQRDTNNNENSNSKNITQRSKKSKNRSTAKKNKRSNRNTSKKTNKARRNSRSKKSREVKKSEVEGSVLYILKFFLNSVTSPDLRLLISNINTLIKTIPADEDSSEIKLVFSVLKQAADNLEELLKARNTVNQDLYNETDSDSLLANSVNLKYIISALNHIDLEKAKDIIQSFEQANTEKKIIASVQYFFDKVKASKIALRNIMKKCSPLIIARVEGLPYVKNLNSIDEVLQEEAEVNKEKTKDQKLSNELSQILEGGSASNNGKAEEDDDFDDLFTKESIPASSTAGAEQIKTETNDKSAEISENTKQSDNDTENADIFDDLFEESALGAGQAKVKKGSDGGKEDINQGNVDNLMTENDDSKRINISLNNTLPNEEKDFEKDKEISNSASIEAKSTTSTLEINNKLDEEKTKQSNEDNSTKEEVKDEAEKLKDSSKTLLKTNEEKASENDDDVFSDFSIEEKQLSNQEKSERRLNKDEYDYDLDKWITDKELQRNEKDDLAKKIDSSSTTEQSQKEDKDQNKDNSVEKEETKEDQNKDNSAQTSETQKPVEEKKKQESGKSEMEEVKDEAEKLKDSSKTLLKTNEEKASENDDDVFSDFSIEEKQLSNQEKSERKLNKDEYDYDLDKWITDEELQRNEKDDLAKKIDSSSTTEQSQKEDKDQNKDNSVEKEETKEDQNKDNSAQTSETQKPVEEKKKQESGKSDKNDQENEKELKEVEEFINDLEAEAKAEEEKENKGFFDWFWRWGDEESSDKKETETQKENTKEKIEDQKESLKEKTETQNQKAEPPVEKEDKGFLNWFWRRGSEENQSEKTENNSPEVEKTNKNEEIEKKVENTESSKKTENTKNSEKVEISEKVEKTENTKSSENTKKSEDEDVNSIDDIDQLYKVIERNVALLDDSNAKIKVKNNLNRLNSNLKDALTSERTFAQKISDVRNIIRGYNSAIADLKNKDGKRFSPIVRNRIKFFHEKIYKEVFDYLSNNLESLASNDRLKDIVKEDDLSFVIKINNLNKEKFFNSGVSGKDKRTYMRESVNAYDELMQKITDLRMLWINKQGPKIDCERLGYILDHVVESIDIST